MNIGAYRHRVTVQTQTETSDGHDGFTVAWAALRARIAAMVEPLSGRDLDSARQIDPRISHRVSLRYWRDYVSDLKGGRTRLVYHPSARSDDDRTFEPVTPPLDVDERHVEIQIACRELA